MPRRLRRATIIIGKQETIFSPLLNLPSPQGGGNPARLLPARKTDLTFPFGYLPL